MFWTSALLANLVTVVESMDERTGFISLRPLEQINDRSAVYRGVREDVRAATKDRDVMCCQELATAGLTTLGQKPGGPISIKTLKGHLKTDHRGSLENRPRRFRKKNAGSVAIRSSSL